MSGPEGILELMDSNFLFYSGRSWGLIWEYDLPMTSHFHQSHSHFLMFAISRIFVCVCVCVCVNDFCNFEGGVEHGWHTEQENLSSGVIQSPSSQSYGFSSGHAWVWEMVYKESWVLKNLCFWTVVLEMTLESPLDRKEIQPVHPKGNQPRIFIGRTNDEAEAPVLWLPGAKNWLTGKDPDAGKDWRQKEKSMAEDEMVR